MDIQEGRSTFESLVGDVSYSLGQIEVLKAGAFPERIILYGRNGFGQAKRKKVLAIGKHGRADDVSTGIVAYANSVLVANQGPIRALGQSPEGHLFPLSVRYGAYPPFLFCPRDVTE